MKKTLTYSYYLIGYGCIITALISIFKLIHKLDLHAPDPLTGLIFIGSTTNAIVLFNTKIELFPYAGMFDWPDECVVFGDYLTYPFGFGASLVMWVVTNLMNFLALVALWSGGVTFGIALALYVDVFPIPLLTGIYCAVGTFLLYILTRLGNTLGLRNNPEKSQGIE